MLEKIKTKIVSLCYWLCFRLCIVTIGCTSVDRSTAIKLPTIEHRHLADCGCCFVCLLVCFAFFMDIDYVSCCFTIYYLFASVAYSFSFSLVSYDPVAGIHLLILSSKGLLVSVPVLFCITRLTSQACTCSCLLDSLYFSRCTIYFVSFYFSLIKYLKMISC